MSTRVAVLCRAGVAAVLRSADDLDLVAEAATIEDLLGRLARTSVDVVVAESPDGEEAVELAWRLDGPGPPAVLVLAESWHDGLARALWAGARGVVLTPSGVDRLVDAVRLVAAGYLLAPVADSGGPEVREWFAPGWNVPSVDGMTGELSERELEVLRLVSAGLGNEEISRVLSVSASTVKSHVRSLLSKLRVPNRSRLVIVAFESGLVQFSTTRD